MSAAAVTVLIHGVPEGARLSAGKRRNDDTWELAPADLDELQIASPVDRELNLKVRVVRKDCEQALQVHVRIEAGRPAALVSESADDSQSALGNKRSGPLDALYRAICPSYGKALSFV
jgi:hypothetical protein